MLSLSTSRRDGVLGDTALRDSDDAAVPKGLQALKSKSLSSQ